MGRGVNAPHRRSHAQDDLVGVPHMSMDYGFFGEGESEEQVSLVLVIRERRLKMTWADGGSEKKERNFPWIAKRAARFIDQLGHNRVTLRCDSEPAIEALAREIGTSPPRRESDCARETTSGESQSNGIIERVAGPARTLSAALEHRIGASVPPDRKDIVLVGMEFAAYLMNRCDIGRDGKTPL